MKKLFGFFACSIIVCLSIFAFVGCDSHKHTLIKHEAIAATCDEDGRTEYYSCDECDKFFQDENAKTEIKEGSWIISALGHDYRDDGVCFNCDDELTVDEMAELGYVAKVSGIYYKSLSAALNIGENTDIICDIDVSTNSEYLGYAYGVWLDAGEINGNDNTLEMTFEDNNKFSGLWLLENAAGVKNLNIVSDTKTAVYIEDINHKVAIENNNISTAGSGVHVERCSNVVLKNNNIESTDEAGYKAAVFAGDGADVVVESGNYKAENAVLTGGSAPSSVTINGGTFAGKITVNGSDTLVINGGTFSVDPSKWVSVGHTAKNNGNGTWTVEVEVEVSTAAELIAAVSNGGNVKLTSNITLTSQLVVKKQTSIDLNGKTMTTSLGAYNKLFFAKNNFNISSSAAGGEIELSNASLLQVSSDYPDSIVNISNVTINRTATSGSELILNYGTVNAKDTIFNLPGGSIGVFKTYGDFKLGKGTVINVSGVLGTSLISNQAAADVIIDGAEFNITSFKVNGGALFSRNKGASFTVEDIKLNIVLDETYTSYFLNTVEGVDGAGQQLVKLNSGTYNVTGASGKYSVTADGKWILNQ